MCHINKTTKISKKDNSTFSFSAFYQDYFSFFLIFESSTHRIAELVRGSRVQCSLTLFQDGLAAP